MSKIILVAESGSDITSEIAKEYGIVIVPMHVTFADYTRDDGTFEVEEIPTYYKKTGNLPKTSGCSPNDFEIFEKIHEENPNAHILYLAYSAVTTCSFQSAFVMAKDKDYVTLIDTRQVSLGQGLVVVQVARYLKNHPEAQLNEVVAYANDMINRTKMCFIPDNLEFLRAGGRVSNAAFLGATILNLHPTIEILDGKLIATKKYRGKMSRVCAKLLRETTEKDDLDRQILWCGNTVGINEEVKEKVIEQAEELGFKEIHWLQANGVITTHGGPGAFGFAALIK